MRSVLKLSEFLHFMDAKRTGCCAFRRLRPGAESDHERQPLALIRSDTFKLSRRFYECMTILQSGKFVMTGGIDSMWRLQGRTIAMLRPGLLGKMQFQVEFSSRHISDLTDK